MISNRLHFLCYLASYIIFLENRVLATQYPRLLFTPDVCHFLFATLVHMCLLNHNLFSFPYVITSIFFKQEL
jgi:hypothetical protein